MLKISVRPSRVLAAAIITIIVLTFTLRQNGWSLFGPGLPPKYTHPIPGFRGYFRWGHVPERYPVKGLRELPTARSAKLPGIQFAFPLEDEADKVIRLRRQAAVKASFTHCYKSYRERAWMQDELSPISGASRNTVFGGWGATLVDSLDTLWIMEMKDELKDAIQAVAGIDLTKSTDDTINVFETTIRYLGGLLSAYDLTKDKTLLHKAVEVGEMLLVPFDTPNHMPVCRWEWRKSLKGEQLAASETTLISEIGSLSLEFTRLSQVTRDPRWFDAITRITEMFDRQQHETTLPGLWPISVNARDMILTKDTWYTLGGMADSVYEYLPKMFALLGGLERVYRKMYEDSMATAIKHLFFKPMTPSNEDILIAGNVRAKGKKEKDIILDPQGQHLGCFAGGMLALGGKLFDIPDHVAIGRKLVDGCIWAYRASANGIMPETFHLVPCTALDKKAIEKCKWDHSAWLAAVKVAQAPDLKAGKTIDQVLAERRLPPPFTAIGDPRYILRPEAIESIFILYRITGEKYLQEYAWEMFQTIQNNTVTEYGNAALEDVTYNFMPPRKNDRMESFWMGETLKYFYLIFSEPELISLDDYVFNTEAHPFRRPA